MAFIAKYCFSKATAQEGHAQEDEIKNGHYEDHALAGNVNKFKKT